MNPRYIFFSFVFSFFSCQDKCDKYTTYIKSTPKYLKMESLRDSVYFDIEREINSPGKLNYKDGYLFISEVAKGVHVIDNRNVNNPIKIGFINIPGNYDIEDAVKQTKIKLKDKFIYDSDPTILTSQIEKLTRYPQRKQNLKDEIKRLEKSSEVNKEKKIFNLEKKDTLGDLPFFK